MAKGAGRKMRKFIANPDIRARKEERATCYAFVGTMASRACLVRCVYADSGVIWFPASGDLVNIERKWLPVARAVPVVADPHGVPPTRRYL